MSKTAAKTTTARAKAAKAKVPQDRLPKAEAENTPVSIEYRGVDITVAPDDLDDYEAAALLSQGMPDRMLTILVPDPDTRKRLIETCREPGGRLRLTAVVIMTSEILKAVGAGN